MPVGRSDAQLEGNRSIVRQQATNLGQIIGQSMIEQTGADFAVINAGGIRDSLPAGTITWQGHPEGPAFGGPLATDAHARQRGADYLQQAAHMQRGSGGFAHLRGVELTLAGDALQQARIQGAVVQADKTYTMVINHFMGVGGDGYPALTAHPGYVNTGFVDGEAPRFCERTQPPVAARFAPIQP